MKASNFTPAVFISAIVFIASCSEPAEVSRASTNSSQYHRVALSEITRRFIRQTPETVSFSSEQYALGKRAQMKIDIQAKWILRHPNVQVVVYGHTDKIGNSNQNDKLALRRANAVLNHMVSRGINPERLTLRISQIENLPIPTAEKPSRENFGVTTLVMGNIDDEADLAVAANEQIASIEGLEPSTSVPDDATAPSAQQPSAPTENTSSTSSSKSKSSSNSGRGNGDEDSDPGKSGGKNKGGDE